LNDTKARSLALAEADATLARSLDPAGGADPTLAADRARGFDPARRVSTPDTPATR
jgi:hypothetical protein